MFENQLFSYFAVLLAGLVFGAVLGGLIIRNNVKHFSKDAAAFKKVIADARLTAEQKILRIRNKLGV
jgi:hypothetical protein